MAQCSASLIELSHALKREIEDEKSASEKYADMAAKFTHLGEPISADLLMLISGQEALHQAVLEFIADEIKARCGKEWLETAERAAKILISKEEK